jgi:Ca2+-binding EF-hand superfamily protein
MARGGGWISSLRDAETDQRKKALEAAFKAFDDDDCGLIHKDDLEAVGKKLGTPTEQLIPLFMSFDSNGDSDIDFEEFKQLVKEVEKLRDNFETWDSLYTARGGGWISSLRDTEADQREKALDSAFKAFDDDDCGLIHKDDLEAVAKKLGTPTEQLIPLFMSFDSNGDSEIDFEEFKQLVKEVEKLRDSFQTWDSLYELGPLE